MTTRSQTDLDLAAKRLQLLSEAMHRHLAHGGTFSEFQGSAWRALDQVTIQALVLSTRVIIALNQAGIMTIGDIRRGGVSSLFTVPNLGQVGIVEVLQALADRRISL